MSATEEVHGFRAALGALPLKFPLPVEAQGAAARLRSLVRSSEVVLALVAAVVGTGAGALVTGMSAISQAAHVLFFGIAVDQRLSAATHLDPARVLAAPLFGGCILGLMELLRRTVAARRTPVDPIEANALRGGRMSLRDSIVVTVQTLISNGFGASVGLEAGYTQIGSGLASRLGIVLALRRQDLRVLVGAGAAGAIAAAFGAPITGAFYAFELVVGVYTVSNVAPIMAASLAAWLTAQALGGSPYAFHAMQVYPLRPSHYLVILGLGLISTGLGVVAMRGVELSERLFRATRLPPWATPALGGLIMGGLGLVTPQVLAAGHGAMAMNLAMTVPMKVLIGLIALKMLAALVSLGSGFRGGLFFSSLFMGSLTGKLFGEAFTRWLPDYGLDPSACMLAGMGTLAVAIVGGPLTMSFLVLETTGDLGLTAAVLTACVGTSLAVRETFGYSFSTWRLHLRGETIRSAADVGWIRSLTVNRLMRSDPKLIEGDATIAQLRRQVPLGSTQTVIAVDADGRYLGVVLLADAFAPERDADKDTRTAASLARWPEQALLPEMNVKMAMSLFERAEAETLAVVDTPDTLQVVGYLTEGYAARRYAEELDKASRGLVGEG